jgi:FkbM family methyltransferase
MSHTYYYFYDRAFPIEVTQKTIDLTSATFRANQELWENSALKQFFSRIDPEKNVNIIDIGAQTGLYSLYAKFLPRANFFAFEPFKPTFDVLNENLILNGITNVSTKNIALADHKGSAILSVCNSHNGLHSLTTTPLRFSDVTQISVETSTLDTEFFEKGIPVHFIKIDTEGGEYAILKGGINTLRTYKPMIQLEWNLTNMRQTGVTEDQLSELLDSLGYKQIGCEDEERLFSCTNEN